MESRHPLDYPNQNIVPVVMEDEVRQSFLEYSMSVIVSRALPDVRDGLKPGQRRILYAMYEDHLTSNNAFRKSATTVGNVLGRYHPHGDAAVYTTMVRMAQPFSMRHILVEGHGNFCSVDGDPPAAYRYTEARLAKISDEMMRDIEKDTVKWNKNFDNTRDEPDVLPSRFPNILVNGSVGIAVGMATNIPPHNLGEVIDATVHMIDHPDCTTADLIGFIKGPDFPTGASIYGTAGIYEAYTTGHGRLNVRAKAELDEENHRIIISEIPYMVNKSMLVEAMANQVKEKRIEGVTDIRDESGRNGMRIVIEYKKDAPGQIILNHFYKYTQLQDTCAVNMLALVNGEPKVLPLRDILTKYVEFQKGVITRRVEFDLRKALKDAHLQEGYRIAIDNIDEVIRVIRSSRDTNEAKVNLMETFRPGQVESLLERVGEYDKEFADGFKGLSEEQATAIVQMPLGRLSGMEREKVMARLADLERDIAGYREILADPDRVSSIVKDELEEIKRKYATPRRTEILEAEDDIVYEDLIERHTALITMSNAGYIKRIPADTYSAQNRGGHGIRGMSTKEDDFVRYMLTANSHSNLLFFTSLGRVYMKKVYLIPEAGRTAKGTYITNVIDLEKDERVTAMLETNDFPADQYLLTVTKNGIVKRTSMDEYAYKRKGGKIALRLDEGDELIFVAITRGGEDLLVVTRNGVGGRFSEDNISVIGRTGRGVIGLRLREGDEVIGAAILQKDAAWCEENKILFVTENGFGKKTDAGEFLTKGRGILGVSCYGVSEKTGRVCGVSLIREGQDIMMITDGGTLIRTPGESVPVYGRTASGVIMMRMEDSTKLVQMAVTDRDETPGEDDGENEDKEAAEE